MIKQNHILRFNNLSQFPSLIHGFSTTHFGSMRPTDPNSENGMKAFLSQLSIPFHHRVRMHQVAGNIVQWVSQKDWEKTKDSTDGLLTQERDVFPRVLAGDCLPILFYDRQNHVCGIAHAGWRGIYHEIIKVMLKEMISKGSDPKNISAGIGPGIRVCCYNVNEERQVLFKQKYGEGNFLVERDEKVFLDLPLLAKQQLLASGVLENNIEDGDYCTFDHTDVYSFRREGKDFGEMMGIIGLV